MNPERPICTVCGKRVEGEDASYISGDVGDRGMVLRWACDHHPNPDAEIILGSHACAVKWAEENPEFIPRLVELLAPRKTESPDARRN